MPFKFQSGRNVAIEEGEMYNERLTIERYEKGG